MVRRLRRERQAAEATGAGVSAETETGFAALRTVGIAAFATFASPCSHPGRPTFAAVPSPVMHLLAAVGDAIVAPHRRAPQPAERRPTARGRTRSRASRPRGRDPTSTAAAKTQLRRERLEAHLRVRTAGTRRPTRRGPRPTPAPAPRRTSRRRPRPQVVSTAQPARRMPSRDGRAVHHKQARDREPAQRGRPRPPSRAVRPGARRRHRPARRGSSLDAGQRDGTPRPRPPGRPPAANERKDDRIDPVRGRATS